mgnify:CR=1 FL=1
MQDRITKSDNLDINSIKKIVLGYDTFDEYHSFAEKKLQDISEENKLKISIEKATNENEHWKNEIMRKFLEVR